MITLNSEKKILNYILTKDSKYIKKVKEEYFTDSRNKAVFNAIKKNNSNIEKILIENPFLEEDIEEIITERTSFSSIENHLEILIECNKEKKLIEAAKKIIDKKGKVGVSIIEEVEKAFSEMNTEDNNLQSLDEISKEWKNNKKKKEFIKYGMRLEEDLKFEKGDLVVIGARASMGKTLFGIQLLMNMAYYGSKTLCFSLEMKNEQLFERILANITDTAMNKIRDRGYTPEEKAKMEEKLDKHIKKMNFKVTDKVYSFSRIKETILKEKQKNGLDVVLIDFLQIVSIKSKNKGNRNLELGELSRELKLLALKENILIIFLSQLNREVDKRPDKRPLLSDLRSSGDLEQNVNSALMVYREEYYNPNTPEKNIMEIIIAKNRQGGLTTVPMFVNYNMQRVSDLEYR